MNAIGKAAINQQISSATSGAKYATKSTSGINWNDFNYPPLIKVIHYNRMELSPPHRGVAFMLWICHISILVISLVNLLNNIVQVADSAPGIRIGYSFVFLILFNPLAGVTFYKGLRAFLEDEAFLMYKIFSAILCVAYIVFAIGAFGNFNGFVRIGSVGGFAAFLCVVESIMFLLTALLHGLLIFKAVKWDQGPAQVLDPAASSQKDRSNSQISQP